MTSDRRHAVLFDLDGTLIDSVADLAAAVNRALTDRGLQPLQVGDVRGMIGNGMAKLVQRAYRKRNVELDAAELSREYAAVVDHYEADLYSHTQLLPGALEALRIFKEAGVFLAVVTNKPQRASELILQHFGLSVQLDLIVGGDQNLARKPAPDMIEYALGKLNVQSADALMIGDSPADAGAAGGAGVRCVIVRGGYNADASDFSLSPADRVINSLNDVSTDMLFRVDS